MTTAIAEAPAALRLDWPFFVAALLSIAVLVALVLLDGQPASAGLLLCGFALGIVFLKAEFSFTASWRRFIVHGHADGLLGALLLIAVAAVVVVPVAAVVPGFGGAIAPLGPSLVIGAFLFGIGMQLANGCGSGTLYTVGGGSGRMLVTLAFFILGSLIGSLHLPVFLALGGIDPVLASAYAGAWGGLALTLASLVLAGVLIVAVTRRRGARVRPQPVILIGALAIGLLSIAVFALGRHPWSVTFGFTLWGGKIASALGVDLSTAEFWQWPGPRRALAELGAERYLEPDRLRDDPGRHGRGRRAAVRAHALAAVALARRRRDRWIADGLRGASRIRLQHRRLRRRCGLRLTARLDMVCRGARRLRPRYPTAAGFRPFSGMRDAVRWAYAHRARGRYVGDRRRPPVEPLGRSRRLAGGFCRRVRTLRSAVPFDAQAGRPLTVRRGGFAIDADVVLGYLPLAELGRRAQIPLCPAAAMTANDRTHR